MIINEMNNNDNDNDNNHRSGVKLRKQQQQKKRYAWSLVDYHANLNFFTLLLEIMENKTI